MEILNASTDLYAYFCCFGLRKYEEGGWEGVHAMAVLVSVVQKVPNDLVVYLKRSPVVGDILNSLCFS